MYIVETKCGKLYTGISTDVERRFKEHLAVSDGEKGALGAKYFRGRQPNLVAYSERCISRSEASKREYAIKSMTRKKKLELIAQSQAALKT